MADNIWIAAPQLLEVTFGQSYVSAAPLLRLFDLAAGLRLWCPLVHYRMALNDIWPLRAIVLATVGESLIIPVQKTDSLSDAPPCDPYFEDPPPFLVGQTV